MQTTLGGRATLAGIGVHSGRAVSLTMHPAEAGSGVRFSRTHGNGGGGGGGNGRRDREIRADFRHVSATDHCTAVGGSDASVSTIEHLMATLGALAVDNAVIEIDGPEVPVMDGSASAFLEAVDQAGIAELDRPRRCIKVVKPVRVQVGDSLAEFKPHDGMRIEIEIDFASPVIGRQRFAADVDAALFRREIARARTFGFLAEVERLWARGMALGASLENAIVVGDDRIINPEGLRYDDEFVRHKALDAVGDLALIGAPIRGCYRSYRGGHRLNVKAVAALIADRDAWTWVEAPAPRERRHGGLAAGVGVAAFGPQAS